MEFIEYSLESLRDESIQLAKMVEQDGYVPDCVAYLARGGWVIGEAVASHFSVPVIELTAHRSGDVVKDRSAALLSRLPRSVRKALRESEIRRRLRHDGGTMQQKTIRITERYPLPNAAEKILLVDDSADTGASITAAVAELARTFLGAEIRVAVLNVFPRATEGCQIDWHFHKGCLLCLPSSKDNREYFSFMEKYESLPLATFANEIVDGGPLISVIVAFYNVDSCVDYCVHSLIAQTYQNYELILVDDGSTDSTGKKLDAYASNPKVRVVHKTNGGLSEARNYGVGIAKGDYISFVDGDDLVSPRYLETLSKGLRYGKNVLVSALPKIIPIKCAASFSWEDSFGSDTYHLLTNREALEKVLYEKIKTSAWGKLAPKSLYEAHRFPEGKYYEEIATIGAFVTTVDGVVQTDAEIYGYVMRPNSIVHRKSATMTQVYDYFDAVSELVSRAVESGADRDPIAYHKCLQFSRIHTLLGVVEDSPEALRARSYALSGIKESITNVLHDPRVSFPSKARFSLLSNAPRLYDTAFSLFERIKKGIK